MNIMGPGLRTADDNTDVDSTSELRMPSFAAADVAELDQPYLGPRLELKSARLVPVLHPASGATGEHALVDADALLQQREQLLAAREQQLQAALAEVAEARHGRATLLAENQSLTERCTLLEEALHEAVERVATAEASAAEGAPSIRALQQDLRMQRQRILELESDLRAAESQVHRVEALLRQPQNRPAPGAGPGMGTGTAGEAVAALSDSARIRMQAAPGAAPVAEAPTRYLMLIEGDTETLFTLQQRTSIGREPDNDIQVDTRFISRHHAVVHVGLHHTVIEDLGSTNGVVVNGQRVHRRALGDGDMVQIGKSRFRFFERSPRPDFG
jgi:hypothetical protein